MDETDEGWRPKCRDALHRTSVDQDQIVLDRQGQLVHQLNAVAAFILEQCDGEATPEAITRSVIERFAVSLDQARVDVENALKNMKNLGLIE